MDSAIYTRGFNSRALNVHNNSAAFKGCKRERDGTLWAIFYEEQAIQAGFYDVSKGKVYKSTNDGFTWTALADIAGDYEPGGWLQGIPVNIFDNEYGQLFVLTMTDESPPVSIRLILVNKETGATSDFDYDGEIFEYHNPFNEEFWLGQVSSCGDATTNVYLFWSDITDGALRGMALNFGFAYPEPFQVATADAVVMDGVCDSISVSGICHVAGVEWADKTIVHTAYTKGDLVGTFTNYVNVAEMSTATNIPIDVGIDKDGFETVGVAWGEINEAATSGDIKYALSMDDGGSFSVSGTLPAPVGTSGYQDHWAETEAAGSGTTFRTRILGGIDTGFLIGGIYKELSTGRPQAYVNELGTPDGATYTPSGWVKVASRDDQNITGIEFFRPMNDDKNFFGEKGDSRMAYLVGDGDHEYGDDKTRSAIFQERLTNVAYPNALSNDLLTQKRVDFHASGMIGQQTTDYVEAFETKGVSGHIARFEPVSNATSNGESAYTKSTEYNTQVFFDVISYNSPASESVATSSQTAAAERDIRKIFLRPDFFMDRTFLVNDGGFLKRTVWIIEYLGNTYEITQIIPRFVDDQIVNYEANAFVVGPSNNPFSRTTLPSET